MTTLSVSIAEGYIVFNPQGHKGTIALSPIYAGRAASALRQVVEGGVIDADCGVVQSQTDPSKVYIYDWDRQVMVEACRVIAPSGEIDYRRSKDVAGHTIPSQGYFYEWENQWGDHKISTLTYDSHHLAVLIALGWSVSVPDTRTARRLVDLHQRFAETNPQERGSFKWKP